jgi:hypothetical protein
MLLVTLDTRKALEAFRIFDLFQPMGLKISNTKGPIAGPSPMI